MKAFLTRAFLAMIAAVGLLEVVLRYGFGFCNAPLYVADPDYEYIYAPDQEVKRFGNHIRTNSLSMRSEALTPADSIVVLLIGDSVVNGGSLTDQDSLASTILERRLSAKLKCKVRVLNISAGSWGPDNGAASLKKPGLFGAKLMCLVASSHDAHDNMTHHEQVGIDPNLPDKPYPWALTELWQRYLYPLYFRDLDYLSGNFAPLQGDGFGAGIRKDGERFNTGFAALKAMAQQQGIPFFIYLHPEISEVEMKNYNEQGQEILRFAAADSIRLIRELDSPPSLSFYRERDIIHYNARGQLFLADNLYPLFLEYLTKSP